MSNPVTDQKEGTGRTQHPPCPKCKTPARYMTSILDVQQNRSVPIYRCDPCGQEIWSM